MARKTISKLQDVAEKATPVSTYQMKALCGNCKQSGIYDITCGRKAALFLEQSACNNCGCSQVLINPEPVAPQSK